MKIHWLRVVLIALVLEVVLFAVLMPISFVNRTAFLVAVPLGVFVMAFVITCWLLKPVSTGPLLHGTLVGIVATMIYFGLVIAQPGGIQAAVAGYGVPLFWFSQALRIAGCIAGATQLRLQPAAAGAITSRHD